MLYNTIHHDIRNEASLSMLDYCILELIYNLSTSGKEKYTSWCNASKSSFLHLASSRTIINRFNHLESKGWIEFKDKSRFLKRTTEKYYNQVMSKIEGVKKLHVGENISPVKKLHTRGEKVAHLGVKKLHTRGEIIAPNKNINNKRDKNINNHLLEEENESLKKELNQLKKQLPKKREKSSAKKEKNSELFPDLSGSKTYVTHDKRTQKDKNELRPFSHNDETARLTLESLFPLDNVELKKQYFDSYGVELSDKQIRHARSSYINNLVLKDKLVMINHVNEFKRMFFHWWLKKDLKYQSEQAMNGSKIGISQDRQGTPLQYGDDLNREMMSKYS